MRKILLWEKNNGWTLKADEIWNFKFIIENQGEEVYDFATMSETFGKHILPRLNVLFYIVSNKKKMCKTARNNIIFLM